MTNNNNTKNLNVPNLRFPEFSGEWKKCTIGELAIKVGSGVTPRGGESVYKMDGHSFVRSQNVGLGHLILDDIAFIDEETHLRQKSTELKLEDVLLNITGASIGRSALVNEQVVGGNVNQHVCIIRTKENLISSFLCNFLLSNYGQRQIDSFQAGGNRQGLNCEQIKSIKIAIPSTKEQTKVAKLLQLIEERIATQIKIIEDLKLLKKELLKKVFFQELRLPEFNENWKIVTLSDVGTFFSGGTPSTSIGQYYNGNIPFIKSGEINADNTEQFISEEGLRNSSAKMVEIGDLIYALYGATSGEVGISKIKGAINQAILCIRTNLNSIFLLNFLMFKKEEILRTYLQGGQGNLSAEIIKSLKIPAPVYAEQTKLSHLFSAFDKKIELETNVMTKFMQQKQYLLANLLI